MTIHIRQATPADASAIARVHVDSWRSSYVDIVPQEILSGLSYDERETLWDGILNPSRTDVHCFVAETRDGRIIGFACGGAATENSQDYEGEIYSIYLLQEYQRMGLGRGLLLSAAAGLRNDGISSLLLWVFEDNHGARQFYEQLGGEVIDSKAVRFGDVELVEVAYGWKDIKRLVV